MKPTVDEEGVGPWWWRGGQHANQSLARHSKQGEELGMTDEEAALRGTSGEVAKSSIMGSPWVVWFR